MLSREDQLAEALEEIHDLAAGRPSPHDGASGSLAALLDKIAIKATEATSAPPPGEPEPQRCPECGSSNICEQTPSPERPPWGCLDCGTEFEEPKTGGQS